MVVSILPFILAAGKKNVGAAPVFKKMAETHKLQSIATVIQQIKKKSKDLDQKIFSHHSSAKKSFGKFDDIELAVEKEKEKVEKKLADIVSKTLILFNQGEL